MNLIINEELRSIIPPLAAEEREALGKSILNEGVRDPIIVWGKTIVDGHNRYEICEELGIFPEIMYIDFDSIEDAKVWMIDNQLGRRNLTDGQKYMLVSQKKEILLEKGRQKMSEAAVMGGSRTKEDFQTANKALSETDKPLILPNPEPVHNTRNEIAKELNWSTGKVAQADKVFKKADEETKQKVISGEVSINKAYEHVKQEEKQSQAVKPPAPKQFNRTNDNIGWAAWSWNPVTGCNHGCPYCYARSIAMRFEGTFEPTLRADRLEAPANTKPRADIEGGNRVFVCSMADLFGDWVDDSWISQVLEQVENHPEWTFLFLTKNPKRYAEIIFPENAWIGATVDTQARVRPTEEAMEKANATVKFVSCEPLLESVIFSKPEIFDWFLIGSKSEGEKKVQPDTEWTKSLISQAHLNGVKVWMKDNLNLIREVPNKTLKTQ